MVVVTAGFVEGKISLYTQSISMGILKKRHN